MRQTTLHIRDARQKDRLELVMMVTREYKFVPVVDAQAVFQQVVGEAEEAEMKTKNALRIGVPTPPEVAA